MTRRYPPLINNRRSQWFLTVHVQSFPKNLPLRRNIVYLHPPRPPVRSYVCTRRSSVRDLIGNRSPPRKASRGSRFSSAAHRSSSFFWQLPNRRPTVQENSLIGAINREPRRFRGQASRRFPRLPSGVIRRPVDRSFAKRSFRVRRG